MVAKQKFSNISILPLTPTKLSENQKKKKRKKKKNKKKKRGERSTTFKRSLNTWIQNKLYFSVYEVTVLHVII